MVLHSLRREATAALASQILSYPDGVYPIDRAVAEERHEMPGQIATVVLDRRALALHDVLEMVDVGVRGLLEGPSFRAWSHDLALDHSP